MSWPAALQAEGTQDPAPTEEATQTPESEVGTTEAVAQQETGWDITGDFLGEPHLITPYVALQQLDSKTGLAIGLGYEYRIKQGIGAGFFAEYSGSEIDATVVAAAGYFRPVEELRLLLGLGVQSRKSDDDFLVRLGGGYAFPVKEGVVLEPGIYIDLVDGDQKLMFGLGLGVSF